MQASLGAQTQNHPQNVGIFPDHHLHFVISLFKITVPKISGLNLKHTLFGPDHYSAIVDGSLIIFINISGI